MNLFKRIKNLWALSEMEILQPLEKLNGGDRVHSLVKRKQQLATIVDMNNPIADLYKIK